MKLLTLTPNLMVRDVNRSVRFYRDVLGFEFVLGVPEGTRDILQKNADDKSLEHALVKSGSVEVMFHRTLAEEFPEFEGQETRATLTLYVMVEDIETCYRNIREKTAILKELNTQWYGNREFYLKDPDGYILGFAESLET